MQGILVTANSLHCCWQWLEDSHITHGHEYGFNMEASKNLTVDSFLLLDNEPFASLWSLTHEFSGLRSRTAGMKC